MITSCRSCGAPAPADASDFSFVCGFCGTKNVDDQYFKEYISKIDTGKANRLLQQGLAFIKGGDYVQAEKSLESSVLEDDRNSDALIYLALCKAANTKPSNFEKNFEYAKDCLDKAKKIDSTEVVELGTINVVNTFLKSTINSANYYLDTAYKKMIAFGKSGSARKQIAEEASRGLKLIRNVFTLNPTDTILTASTLSYAITQCINLEKEIGHQNTITSEKEFFISNLKNLYETHKDIVKKAINQSSDKSSDIIKLLESKNNGSARSDVSRSNNSFFSSITEKLPEEVSDGISEAISPFKNLSPSFKKFLKILAFFLGVLLLISFIANLSAEKKVASPSSSPSTEPVAASQPVPASKVEEPNYDNLGFLKSFDGKYPADVKLFDNPVLSSRLTKILGNRFNFLKENFAVESPMTINQNIFIARGCQAHNCVFTNFIIIADIEKNIIYIGIREEQDIKTYSEDGSDALSKINEYSDWSSN